HAGQKAPGRIFGGVQELVVIEQDRLRKRAAVERGEKESEPRPETERDPAFHIFHLPKSSSDRLSRNSEYFDLLLVPFDVPFLPLPFPGLGWLSCRRSILRARSITLRATRIGACARSASAIASDGRESISTVLPSAQVRMICA